MKTSRALALCVSLGACSMAQAQVPAPKLTALSAIVMDADTGRVLYFKNCDLKLHPASTTKIMTAMLLLEHCRPEDVITAPPDVDKVRESSLHLMPSEQVKVSEMLYALMLRSANDGCHTVALHIAGSEAEFAKLMNERAKEIGCTNTNFVNPHGLTHPKHLTTARDLAMMAREAMKDPVFAGVVGTQKHTIERSLNQKDTLLVNRNKFLLKDPRARGVKTGYTKAAGSCFVGCATDRGMTFITVVMKSEKWLDEQKALTDWAFDNFELREGVSAGQELGEANVENGTQEKVVVVASEGARWLLPKLGAPQPSTDVGTWTLKAPLAAGTKVGKVEFQVNGVTVGEVEAMLATDVKERPMLSAMFSHPATLIGFVILGGSTYLVRRKSRRMAGTEWR